MGWLFGFVGDAARALEPELRLLHEPPLFGSVGQNHYVQAGGPRITCRGGPTSDRKGTWLATGLALVPGGGELLGTISWQSVLSGKPPGIDRLDGHFVAAVARPEGVDIFTDPLGVRTLHYASHAGGYAFSTRLDWLTKLCGGLAIDYEAFGSFWLAYNQLSTRSLLSGAKRLGPGGRLSLRPQSIHQSESPWQCPVGSDDPAGAALLRGLRRCCAPEGMGRISLGLSGGMDSRLLLALGAHEAHVFGPSDHPDVTVARVVASRAGVRLHHLHDRGWGADQALRWLRARSSVMPPISAASAVLDAGHFAALHQAGLSVIDGGFGEVARRQFMNRLLMFGKGWSDSERALALIGAGRPRIFAPDVAAAMRRGALQDIEQQRDGLPAGIGPEDALDMIGVRTRLPNFFGWEQGRLDATAACLMPYAQPSVLKALFQVPLSQRRGGRLFRRTIRNRLPAVARLPLVKGTAVSPFWLPAWASLVLSHTRKRAGITGYQNPRAHQFLQAARPAILDLLGSETVRTCAVYDLAALQRIIRRYYAGDRTFGLAVDWWLAFELWRQTVEQRAWRHR